MDLDHTVTSLLLDDARAVVELAPVSGRPLAIVVDDPCWVVAAGAIGRPVRLAEVGPTGTIPAMARGALGPGEVTGDEWAAMICLRLLEAAGDRPVLEIVGLAWSVVEGTTRPDDGW